MSSSKPQITAGIAFDALSERYRRRLLLALLDQNPQRDDDELDTDEDVDRDADEAERIRIAMQHTHLPKLEEMGFIEWDRQTNEIRKGPNFDEIQPLLELLDNHRDELPDDWL